MDRVKAVVDKAKAYHVPIRVGVNSGSLEKDLIAKYGGHVTAEGIVESALDKVHLIEDLGYDQMVISIKSSDVMMCVKAHEPVSYTHLQGGYRLARLPKDYTIGMILRLTEGDLSPVACTDNNYDCPKMQDCVTIRIWKELDLSLIHI